MKRKGIVAALAMVVLSIGVLWITGWNQQEMIIAINQDEVHHIIANIGMGSQRLNYDEHHEIIDQIVAMVNGEYRYKKDWNNDGRSGGGPYLVRFVNESGRDECELRYINGYLAVATDKDGHFYLYTKNGEPLQFDEFETYLNEYGVFDR